MINNFVFDLDGAIVVAPSYKPQELEKNIKEKLGNDFFHKHYIVAYEIPYYIFPGYYALFQWLYSFGAKIFFFSSGIEARNTDLVNKIMKAAFGEGVSGIEYKIFSRQHCIDTSKFRGNEEEIESIFEGQRKKKLGGVVVPESEVPNSLLIDDDNTFMTKGEEYNFIGLRYCYQYLQENAYNQSEAFYVFHKAYYLAGLFSKILEVKDEKRVSLVEAAKYVQIDLEGKVLDKKFDYPSLNRAEYYFKGKEILNKFDPTLDFYYPFK